MKFNEDSRVKIPAILHCMSLGYEYISLRNKNFNINEATNIFTEVFLSSIKKINPGLSTNEARQALDEILLALENEDLGRAFYKKLINRSGVRLIDFDNFDQNTFQVVTELTYKNGDDEFRPDITILINGMPLVFIEVKKPNKRKYETFF
jgi:type I restriction enzyme R subunit